MAKRHVMFEVEQKGLDPEKPHRINKATIKLFKGANDSLWETESVKDAPVEKLVPKAVEVKPEVKAPEPKVETIVAETPAAEPEIQKVSEVLEVAKPATQAPVQKVGKKAQKAKDATEVKVDVPGADD